MKTNTLDSLYKKAYKLIDQYQARSDKRRLLVHFELEEQPDRTTAFETIIAYGITPGDYSCVSGNTTIQALERFEAQLKLFKGKHPTDKNR